MRFVSAYEKCQRAGMAIGQRHEIPQQPILFCEVFDMSNIDFMGSFQSLKETFTSSLSLTTSRDGWKLTPPRQMMQKLLFGVSRALIGDQGSHFYNKTMSTLLEKYGIPYGRIGQPIGLHSECPPTESSSVRHVTCQLRLSTVPIGQEV
ncbi:hypothetical protein CR513_37313, partial [Mucuna pruriens]